jgi:uncharacterized protein DUF3916
MKQVNQIIPANFPNLTKPHFLKYIMDMRQYSFQRPKEKLRGKKRRLNELDTWANSFQHTFPIPHDNQFINWKIPVVDRLVTGPQTNVQIQRHCVSALLCAATHLITSKPAELKESCRIAVLLALPDLFSSEVTVFFDKEYYAGFYNYDQPLPASDSFTKKLGLVLPKGFKEIGTLLETEDEDEDTGKTTKFTEERWTLGEPL